MSVACYTTCRIQFIPNDRQSSERNYSDRSTVELRQFDFADYSLQALDIENNKAEIFNIPLKQQEQYQRGRSVNQPDEVRSKNGTYYLWLNASARADFHEALDTCFEQIGGIENAPPQRSVSPPSSLPRRNSPRNDHEQRQPAQPQREHPTSLVRPEQNNILVDVHQLGHHIRQGNVNDAVDLAKKLAGQRVHLQANPSRGQREEEIIQIKVKIDSNDRRISDKYVDLLMSVYPSTTILELRTAFECTHQFPSSHQHFFVHGHLAHEDSTMSVLNVHSNSLFVLFVIEQ